MSNILIIKHGSLGDIVQISGAIQDIKESHLGDRIFILTTVPYVELLSNCPFIDGVLIDKRLPRWNLLYLIKLKKNIDSLNFIKIYDLQNSSRTLFYRKILFKTAIWSSTQTILKATIGIKRKDFDNDPVLERFNFQLTNSGIITKHTLKPNISWANTNVKKIMNRYIGSKFILLFPFCSEKLQHKKWPYFNELISIIKSKHSNYEIVIAPGPKELEEAKKIKAVTVLNDKKALTIMELAGLIKSSSFVIANDTGPAHMAAHLGVNGVVLFGQHTTPLKVSIERENFKAIISKNLSDLSVDSVYLVIKKKLNSIN